MAHNNSDNERSKVKKFKTYFQMSIGIGIFIVIIIKLLLVIMSGIDVNIFFAADSFLLPILDTLAATSILKIVSSALAYAAAIELAYMLFTPGPDEAVTPLIMGLASLVLSVAARADNYIDNNTQSLLNASIAIGIIVVAIAILFYINEKFFKEKTETANKSITNTQVLSIEQLPELKIHVVSEQQNTGILNSIRRMKK